MVFDVGSCSERDVFTVRLMARDQTTGLLWAELQVDNTKLAVPYNHIFCVYEKVLD